MNRPQRRWAWIPLVMLATVAACESSSAPNETSAFDSAAALADYQSFDQLFATDGWAGFSALSGRTPSAIGAGAAGMQAVASLHGAAERGAAEIGAAERGPEAGRRMAQELLHIVSMRGSAPASGVASLTLISELHRGATFVYDAASDMYVVGSARTDAPANGVRFAISTVDAQDRPVSGEEIGYADLIDNGDAGDSAADLRFVLVTRGTTVLDYALRVAGGDGAGSIDVNGFLVDEQHRLDFDVGASSAVVDGKSRVDLDFDLRIVSRAFSVVGSVRGVDDSNEGDGSVTLTVRHGTNTLQVLMEGDGELIDGEIRLNGRTFVTVTGDVHEPTLLGARGDPITGAELLVMLRVVDTVDDVFDLIEELLEPVDNLIAFGWLL